MLRPPSVYHTRNFRLKCFDIVVGYTLCTSGMRQGNNSQLLVLLKTKSEAPSRFALKKYVFLKPPDFTFAGAKDGFNLGA